MTTEEKRATVILNECVEMLRRSHKEYTLGILNMDRFVTASINPPTMCTNGVYIKAHPSFVLNNTSSTIIFTLKHEIIHKWMKHSLRIMAMKKRLERGLNVEIYKIAADLACNSILWLGKEHIPIALLDGICMPTVGKYEKLPLGKDTEWYYAELVKMVEEKQKEKEEQEKQESGEKGESESSSGGDGKEEEEEEETQKPEEPQEPEESEDDTEESGDDDEEGGDETDGDEDGKEDSGIEEDGEGEGVEERKTDKEKLEELMGWNNIPEDVLPSPETQDEAMTEQAINKEISATYDAMEKAGIMSGALGRMLAQELAPAKIEWTRLLRVYMTVTEHARPSYKRPHRRNFDSRIILPTRLNRTIAHTALVIDVSGSMMGLVEKVVTEVRGIVEQYPKSEVDLIMVDTRVQCVIKVGKGTNITNWKEGINWKGWGGTNMTPGFKEASERGCGLIVCATDLEFGNWPEKPNVPVIWVVPENKVRDVPYGNVVPVS